MNLLTLSFPSLYCLYNLLNFYNWILDKRTCRLCNVSTEMCCRVLWVSSVSIKWPYSKHFLTQPLSVCPWTSSVPAKQEGIVGSRHYFYPQDFSIILLPAQTQTKQWVTDRTSLLETQKKCNFLQILTRCFIGIYSLFLQKQFNYTQQII